MYDLYAAINNQSMINLAGKPVYINPTRFQNRNFIIVIQNSQDALPTQSRKFVRISTVLGTLCANSQRFQWISTDIKIQAFTD